MYVCMYVCMCSLECVYVMQACRDQHVCLRSRCPYVLILSGGIEGTLAKLAQSATPRRVLFPRTSCLPPLCRLRRSPSRTSHLSCLLPACPLAELNRQLGSTFLETTPICCSLVKSFQVSPDSHHPDNPCLSLWSPCHDNAVSPCGPVRVFSVSDFLSVSSVKQKLRALFSTFRSTGTSLVHGPARRSTVHSLATTGTVDLKPVVLRSASSSNLGSSRAFLTQGYSGARVSLREPFTAPGNPS